MANAEIEHNYNNEVSTGLSNLNNLFSVIKTILLYLLVPVYYFTVPTRHSYTFEFIIDST